MHFVGARLSPGLQKPAPVFGMFRTRCFSQVSCQKIIAKLINRLTSRIARLVTDFIVILVPFTTVLVLLVYVL